MCVRKWEIFFGSTLCSAFGAQTALRKVQKYAFPFYYRYPPCGFGHTYDSSFQIATNKTKQQLPTYDCPPLHNLLVFVDESNLLLMTIVAITSSRRPPSRY